jgi:hypothetical protein
MQKATGPGFKEFVERSRDEPVYVILGVQGSGTNLLSRLLTRLFNFSVLRDRSIVFNAAVRLGASPGAADVEREIRQFTQVLWPSALRRKMAKEVIRQNAPFEGIGEELQPAAISSGAGFARLIYAYRAFSVGTTRMAIKSDDLWENLRFIDQVIPNHRVILLTRDFRDNLLSIGGKGFGPVEPLCAATYVKDQLAYYAPAYRRAGENGYHVKFETLLGSTREFAEDFARHFKLPPAVDLDAAIPKQFRPNKIGKWTRLSAQELSWCEGILHDELIEFGYPIASPSPSLPAPRHLMAAAARDKVKRVPQKIRRLVERLSS